MQNLIEIDKYPVKDALSILLQDKTTKKNIIFATEDYKEYGIGATNEITLENLRVIQPRALKNTREQSERTRKKAEVFTPAWLVDKMNNFIDEDWQSKK